MAITRDYEGYFTGDDPGPGQYESISRHDKPGLDESTAFSRGEGAVGKTDGSEPPFENLKKMEKKRVVTTTPLKAKKHFDDFIEATEIDFLRLAKGAMNSAVRSIARNSPVNSGSYVMSNRVSAGGSLPVGPVFLPPAELGEDLTFTMRQMALNSMLRTLKLIKKFREISVENNIHYADRVEHIGWKRTPPYAVYKKAHIRAGRYIEKHMKG